MHRDGLARSGAIQAANIAILFVKAHEAMDGSDFFERGIDRPMRLSKRQPLHTEADERSQPGLGTFNFAKNARPTASMRIV